MERMEPEEVPGTLAGVCSTNLKNAPNQGEPDKIFGNFEFTHLPINEHGSNSAEI